MESWSTASFGANSLSADDWIGASPHRWRYTLPEAAMASRYSRTSGLRQKSTRETK